MGTFEDIGISYSSVSILLGLFIAGLLIFAVLYAIFYVLKGAAVCDMSAAKGLKNPWYSFVPVFGTFAFGRLGCACSRKKSRALAAVLLILEIALCVIKLAAVISAVFGVLNLIFAADEALAAGKELTSAQYSGVLNAYMISAVTLPLALAKRILEAVCAWRIFSVFSRNRAVVFTVISVIIPVLMPIFLFSVKNNKPDFEPTDKGAPLSGFNFG